MSSLDGSRAGDREERARALAWPWIASHQDIDPNRVTPEMRARFARLKRQHDRWAPHTDTQAWADFEAGEAADEARREGDI